MYFKELYISCGIQNTKRIFVNGKNLVFSNGNSVGKTTLLRCLLYAFGYDVPKTRNFPLEKCYTELVINTNAKDIILKRLNPNEIQYIDNSKSTTFILPSQLYELHSLFFGDFNKDLLSSILGVIYFDQEKGWTLLNRGKVIGHQQFNIDTLIRGLSNEDCSTIINNIKSVEYEIARYNELKKVGQFKDKIRENYNDAIKTTTSEDDKAHIQSLNMLKKEIEDELKRIDKSINDNKKFMKFVSDMKLRVKNNGSIILVTKDNVVGFEDNNNYLVARRKFLGNKLNEIENELKKSFIKEIDEYKQLSLFADDDQTIIKTIENNILNLPINMQFIDSCLDEKNKELKQLNKELSNKTRSNTKITMDLITKAKSYLTELNVKDVDTLTWKFLFTSNLKELSGAILHKFVFAYKLSFIKKIEETIGIKLPIILDSPKGKEIDDLNIRAMMEIIKRDFNDNQIIIASIYHGYFDDENKIILETQLLDKLIE